MKGRIPKPQTINDLRGDTAKRRRKMAEPEPSDDLPVCPEWLDEVGIQEWKRFTGQLGSMGLLSSTDQTAIEMYCHEYSLWRRATLRLREVENEVFRTESGYESASAWASRADKHFEACRKMLIEFGCTPASRSRCAVPKKERAAAKWNNVITFNPEAA